MLLAALEVLLAYLFVDLATGLYHFVTDRGWNFAGQVKLFQNHHETNWMDGYDWQPMVIGLPAMVLGLWLGSSFLTAGGAFGILAQVPHYYAHRRSKSRIVHAIVRRLQRARIIIPPEEHAAHHNGTFDRNFCIFSGWNNFWLNWLVAPRS